MKNTTRNILQWIHDNLGDIHRDVTKAYIYTEAWLAGIVCREVGFLIPRKVSAGQSFEYIAEHMKGDSGHGRSFYQIDDRSYPNFVNNTPQSDVLAYAKKAVECLEEKRKYLESKGWTIETLGDEAYERAITAAYNCGQGNVHKALTRGLSEDYYTFTQDYAKCVMEYRYMYYDMFAPKDTALNDTDVPAPVETTSVSDTDKGTVPHELAEVEIPENEKVVEGHDELAHAAERDTLA